MAQVNLLDSSRLSELLEQALAWRSSVSSLMVSATNGAVLAYAFREGRPTMKDIRSLSTTTTTAYTIASEDVLVFEAQLSRALSVLAPVADQILLAVHGPGREAKDVASAVNGDVNGNESDDSGEHEDADAADQDTDNEQQREAVRADLEFVSESLSAILRRELRSMQWPDDI